MDLQALAESMNVRVRREEYKSRGKPVRYGDPVIQGRRGNIHADGAGFSVAIMMKTGKGLRIALENLAALGGEVRQRGDTEAVLYLPPVPTAAAGALRDVLRVKKIRQYSPEALERLRQTARTSPHPLAGGAQIRGLAG